MVAELTRSISISCAGVTITFIENHIGVTYSVDIFLVKRRRTASCQTEQSSPTIEVNRADSEADSFVYSSSPSLPCLQINHFDSSTETSPVAAMHNLWPPTLETISEIDFLEAKEADRETTAVCQTEISDEEVEDICEDSEDGTYESGSDESEETLVQRDWEKEIDLGRVENGLTPLYGTVHRTHDPGTGIDLKLFLRK